MKVLMIANGYSPFPIIGPFKKDESEEQRGRLARHRT